MKTYQYHELTEQGDVVVTKTEAEIITDYWDYWKQKMIQAIYKPRTTAFGRPEIITKERCIEDWVITNWAIEVN